MKAKYKYFWLICSGAAYTLIILSVTSLHTYKPLYTSISLFILYAANTCWTAIPNSRSDRSLFLNHKQMMSAWPFLSKLWMDASQILRHNGKTNLPLIPHHKLLVFKTLRPSIITFIQTNSPHVYQSNSCS